MDNEDEIPYLELNEMKAEVYETLAVINRLFEQLISTLHKLGKRINLGKDYAYNQEIVLNDLLAQINFRALVRITEREDDDRKHYSRMRASLERRRK